MQVRAVTDCQCLEVSASRWASIMRRDEDGSQTALWYLRRSLSMRSAAKSARQERSRNSESPGADALTILDGRYAVSAWILSQQSRAPTNRCVKCCRTRGSDSMADPFDSE